MNIEIVGEKIGFNSPWPNQEVIERLKKIRKSGIHISLCTGKPDYSIDKIIRDANLDGIHITQTGTVVIDSFNGEVVKKHVIENKLAREIIELFTKNNFYTEVYTVDKYYVQENQISETTRLHSHVLQREPEVVTSLVNLATELEIVRVMPITEKDRLALSWGIHPIANPRRFGAITIKDATKREGAMAISKSLGIALENFLGVGDNIMDWDFLELCGFGAAMGNATEELKRYVMGKGDQGYVGKSVDENGIIGIFDHFGF
ncbi:MAG: HAD-superfamily hydrolase, subfamily IIB [Candidatus Gottesmanbacteria bacterium GW2011_GWC2_39_8]|uniref:HAD-superfamily hydrolase, subfamily IIB n=1 Tax=Candidatus Gottesmanbacteria bacterium GW2011_GWC2_39_8 TaxID=1618450 RepID=A0A0G0SF04_9BACT|nr:MAG: HAD-superfamily hydrolase, subfamily IIB [Candidatus Gottesmanbacteria bacterium GW2011_GWC2_39_8]